MILKTLQVVNEHYIWYLPEKHCMTFDGALRAGIQIMRGSMGLRYQIRSVLLQFMEQF